MPINLDHNSKMTHKGERALKGGKIEIGTKNEDNTPRDLKPQPDSPHGNTGRVYTVLFVAVRAMKQLKSDALLQDDSYK